MSMSTLIFMLRLPTVQSSLRSEMRLMADQHRYEIGYRRPPRHTRFKRGESGNPSGRPKGAKNLATVLAETIEEEVTLVEHGTRRKITKLKAAIKKLVDKATTGDVRSMQQLLNLTQWVEGQSDAIGTSDQTMTDADRKVIAAVYQRLNPSEIGEPQ